MNDGDPVRTWGRYSAKTFQGQQSQQQHRQTRCAQEVEALVTEIRVEPPKDRYHPRTLLEQSWNRAQAPEDETG